MSTEILEAADVASEAAVVEEQGTLEASEFAALLKQEFKPKSDRVKDEVSNAVHTLAEQVLEGAVVSDDSVSTINAIIAEIDRKLTEQVNEILHDDEFQSVESVWRGLNYLVKNSETDEMLKVRVLNVEKRELNKMFRRYEGATWDQSPLFKQLYEAEYGQLGGEPYGCLVGDYYFDNSPKDVEILSGMAKIGAACHAPFISAASPNLLQMDGWTELTNPRDLGKITTTPEYATWRSFRDSEDSRYVGLTMPRFLARTPYGADSDPVEAFDFEELVEAGDSSNYCWANSAYAMGVNINKAFKQYGWCSRIRGVESGGAVQGLPTHTFPTDDGGVDLKCPTEIAIADRREAELAKMGLMPLVHRKNSDFAAFIGAQSVQKPFEYEDAVATENAKLSARLPYLFSSCRFAHYLKCIVRDKVGSFGSREEMQRWLTDWIMRYVDGNPENSSESVKAKYPLAAAEVEVSEVEGEPGFYSAKFYLRPHYQLEGMSVSLRLVSKLPSATGK